MINLLALSLSLVYAIGILQSSHNVVRLRSLLRVFELHTHLRQNLFRTRLTRCLHSALASRVLLQLREQIEFESETIALEDEMSLNMMGTTHALDLDEDVFGSRGYASRGGVESTVRGRVGANRNGSRSELGEGHGGVGVDVQLPESRRRMRGSRRHSATPTVSSSVE